MRWLLCIILALAFGNVVQACINDEFSAEIHDDLSLAGTASDELRRAVQGKLPPGPSKQAVEKKLAQLLADPRPQEVDWANQTAGAHLRLGQPQRAADVLEPLREKFPDDYALHANLGTAYHLLGRYSEGAEEIARDVAIDPKAHDGLEVYHLALLQYLAMPVDWQRRHLFIDEWSEAFTELCVDHRLPARDMFSVERPSGRPRSRYRASALGKDAMPAYRQTIVLQPETHVAGAAYMLSLNQNQPSCYVMAGFLALLQEDGALAAEAFDKAIELESPQSAELKTINKFVDEKMIAVRWYKIRSLTGPVALVFIVATVAILVVLRRRQLRQEGVEEEAVGGKPAPQTAALEFPRAQANEEDPAPD